MQNERMQNRQNDRQNVNLRWKEKEKRWKTMKMQRTNENENEWSTECTNDRPVCSMFIKCTRYVLDLYDQVHVKENLAKMQKVT